MINNPAAALSWIPVDDIQILEQQANNGTGGCQKGDIECILRQSNVLLNKLVNRLAPIVLWNPVPVNSIVAGTQIFSSNVNSGIINGLWNNLSAGTVDVYLNNSSTPFWTMTPLNIGYTPFPPMQVTSIMFKVNINSSTAAVGSIAFGAY